MRFSKKSSVGRFGTAMKMMGLFPVIALLLSMSAHRSPSLASQKATVDTWRAASADTFAAAASNAVYIAARPELVWDTDGCSNWFLPDHANDSGATYDFTNACWHHDFEYRNYRRFVKAGLVAHRGAARKAIDKMFARDMRADCAERTTFQRATCNARADLYYRLVRRYGRL